MNTWHGLTGGTAGGAAVPLGTYLPTGISVYRECSPGVSVHAIDAGLLIGAPEGVAIRGRRIRVDQQET